MVLISLILSLMVWATPAVADDSQLKLPVLLGPDFKDYGFLRFPKNHAAPVVEVTSPAAQERPIPLTERGYEMAATIATAVWKQFPWNDLYIPLVDQEYTAGQNDGWIRRAKPTGQARVEFSPNGTPHLFFQFEVLDLLCIVASIGYPGSCTRRESFQWVEAERIWRSPPVDDLVAFRVVGARIPIPAHDIAHDLDGYHYWIPTWAYETRRGRQSALIKTPAWSLVYPLEPLVFGGLSLSPGEEESAEVSFFVGAFPQLVVEEMYIPKDETPQTAIRKAVATIQKNTSYNPRATCASNLIFSLHSQRVIESDPTI